MCTCEVHAHGQTGQASRQAEGGAVEATARAGGFMAASIDMTVCIRSALSKALTHMTSGSPSSSSRQPCQLYTATF
jgi:predicted butyrate kinase (DUF1464 family)